MYINKTQILGNLTRDPEVKALPSGTTVCSFSVATNEVYKDNQGNKKEKVEFHNIVCFGKTAENVGTYMKKGSQIYVEGKLQTRSWEDKDSRKQYKTEILADSVQFGNKPAGNTAPQAKAAAPKATTGQATSLDDLADTPDVIDYPEDIDLSDIPF